jgi:hypothetical protein
MFIMHINMKLVLFLFFLDPPTVQVQQSSYSVAVRRGCDRMVVGFTTTYGISAYHH